MLDCTQNGMDGGCIKNQNMEKIRIQKTYEGEPNPAAQFMDWRMVLDMGVN